MVPILHAVCASLTRLSNMGLGCCLSPVVMEMSKDFNHETMTVIRKNFIRKRNRGNSYFRAKSQDNWLEKDS